MEEEILNWPPKPASPCPLNNFGRGEAYIIPDDVSIRAELERQWEIWETAHPDDPDGSVYLTQYKSKLIELQKANPAFFVEGNAELTKKTTDFLEVTKKRVGRPRTTIGETSKLSLYFPRALADAFEEKCAANGTSMSAVTRAFAQKYIEQ